jgi:DNA polymerase-1
MQNKGKRLVIIDGKSIFYRGYYAMPTLTTADGTPTGGVYGFAMMALEIVKKLKPDYVCVAWDKSKTNIRARLALYPQYKANRKAPPPDFYEQIPLLHQLLEALGWPLYEADDFEADDLMGAFAKQVAPEGVESYLVTSDLDVLQLVNHHTHIYTLKKGLSNIELFNEASFREKYGIEPTQFVDLKALKGDSSDNIPGVVGIGEKTALELLKQYETLDGIYEHLEDIKPTVRAKLEADKDMAYLSKQLVTLIVDAPVQIDLAKAKLSNGVTPEFADLLRRFEFKSLLRQVEAIMPQPITKSETQPVGPHAQLVPLDQQNFQSGHPRMIAVNADFSEVWVSTEPTIFSVLTLESHTSEAAQMTLLGEKPQTPAENASPVKDALQTIGNGPVIGHDLKGLFRGLLASGIIWPSEVVHDTRIGAFLLDSLQRQRQLSDIVGRDIDSNNPEITVPAIWETYQVQQTDLATQPKVAELARTIEFPSISLLATIEHRGILLDSQYLMAMSQKFATRIAEFEQKIYELAGQEFNISSPSQLGVILFDKLGLPTQGVKKGKTGYSTGATELEKLRGLNPIVDLITKYREYTKLKSTYIDSLPKQVDSEGRLHTTFHLDVAPTGRLSSVNPNLQNIPTRTDIGQAIRSAFVPSSGNVFVSADYSQFELRLAAIMAQDDKMIEEFNADIDIHVATAAEVYGVTLDKVDKAMRRNAKVVNFGILYGMSPHGLSIATGMERHEAKEFIDRYFELRPSIRGYMDKIVRDAEQSGYVETLFGRRRPMPDLKSSNFMIREAAKRAAINMPIQGTEADLMKMAMLKVEKELDGLGQQLLQVHDSILVECPKDKAQEVAATVQQIMETIYTLPVQLKVDVSIGNNWGEL